MTAAGLADEGPICVDCEHLNAIDSRFCAACGLELGRAETSSGEPTRVVYLRLSAEELDGLWRIWEMLPDPAGSFAGTVNWPDDGEPLAVLLPDEGRLLSEGAAFPPGRADRLIAALAECVERLHSAGVRVNGLHPGSLVVDEGGNLLGICPPPCLTELGTAAEAVPLQGLNCGFAAPEVQGYAAYPPCAATDVFLLAVIYYYLRTGRPTSDLIASEFRLIRDDDPFGPSVREFLDRSMAIDPADRPPTARAFASGLREALLFDQSRADLVATAGGRSDIGLGGRDVNQDGFVVHLKVGGGARGSWLRGLIAVADGMGGSQQGDRASIFCLERLEAACEGLASVLGDSIEEPSDWVDAAAEWLAELNRETIRLGLRLKAGLNFGSTLSALVLVGQRALLLHAGDSRIYRLRGGEIELLTEVQNYAGHLHRLGELTFDEMEKSEFRNRLVSYVGGDPISPQVALLTIEPGDVFLLCSDGPLDGLQPADMAELLTDRPPDEAVDELLRRSSVRQRDAQVSSDSDGEARLLYSDNMTLVAARFAGRSGGVAR